MKISYIAPFATKFPSSSASSIHMVRMCQALSENGHEVTLFCSEPRVTKEKIQDFYGIAPDFELESVNGYVRKLDRLIFSFLSVKKSKYKKCDLIVSRNGMIPFFSNLFSIDFSFDSHGPVWEKNFVEHFLFKFAIRSRFFKKMTTNSKKLKEMYVAKGYIPNCGIEVANNGADNRVPASAELFELKGNFDINVGYTGHLYSGRGIEIIVECASRLPDIGFHLIGGNKEDVNFWKKDSCLDNLYFYGFVKPSMLAVVRNNLDILLAPYQSSGVAVAGGKGDTSQYMNPIKVIEYFSSGKPIVVSDLPAIKDIVDKDDVVIFVAPDDVDQWVDSILKLKDKGERDKYSKKVLSFFNEGMSWSARARKLSE